MGVQSEVRNNDVIVCTGKKIASYTTVVAIYYISQGWLLAFATPKDHHVEFSDVLKVLKAGGYPVNQRRHIWKVLCRRGQNFVFDFPEEYHYQFLNCNVPIMSAILEMIDEYNYQYEPSDNRYISQLVTL